MRRTTWIRDTADRLDIGCKLRLDGVRLIVEGITNAPTATRPARLALEVSSPSASWAAETTTVYVDAGELVEMAA